MIRAAWKNARWQQQSGEPVDRIDAFGTAAADRIELPVWIGRRGGRALARRRIAVRKSAADAAESRRKARRPGQKDGDPPSQQTLAAAHRFILGTALKAADFATDDVLALDRRRWRVELGFKRRKSVIGRPGTAARSARPHILAHLRRLLLLDPSVDALEDSPRWACAA